MKRRDRLETSQSQDWQLLSARRMTTLKPTAPPVAISFLQKESAAHVVRLDAVSWRGLLPPTTGGRQADLFTRYSDIGSSNVRLGANATVLEGGAMRRAYVFILGL